MHLPQPVMLAESAPFGTWWTLSLEDGATPPTHSFYMQAGRTGYVGVTVTGELDRSEQSFRTRDDLFAVMPYHLGCRRAEISYPHWRVPVTLDAGASITQAFDPIWND